MLHYAAKWNENGFRFDHQMKSKWFQVDHKWSPFCQAHFRQALSVK